MKYCLQSWRLLLVSCLPVVAITAAHAKTMTRMRSSVSAHEMGVGIGFEGAAGLSLYAGMPDQRFMQLFAASGAEGAYLLTGDFAFSYPQVFTPAPVLTPFWGIGAIVMRDTEAFWPFRAEDGVTAGGGLRIPLGLNARVPKTPVQISGEIVPTWMATPVSYSYLQAGISARVVF